MGDKIQVSPSKVTSHLIFDHVRSASPSSCPFSLLTPLLQLLQLQLLPPSSLCPLPPLSKLSFNLLPRIFVQQTRTQANSLKNTLISLASIPGAKRIINRIINDDNNVCLNSVEEAIEAVETSAKIVESAGPEIKNLIKTVEAFEKITDTPTVVREAANILRLLEVLIPKLAPANVQVCGASNAQAFGSLRSLAALVDELSSS